MFKEIFLDLGGILGKGYTLAVHVRSRIRKYIIGYFNHTQYSDAGSVTEWQKRIEGVCYRIHEFQVRGWVSVVVWNPFQTVVLSLIDPIKEH